MFKQFYEMTITRRLILPIVMMAAVVLLSGCSSTKHIPYIQNSDTVKLDSKELYDARIMPKDILTITVSTEEQDAAVPFNLVIPNAMSQGKSNTLNSQMALQNYLVDNDGCVDFPRIGRIKLGGKTKSEAEKFIEDAIKPYLSESAGKAIVTVRMVNYKISVLGEVNSGGMYTVTNEKITIFEALALAGDLTIYGVRDRVKLIREDSDGQKSIHVLNLNDANLLNSPYYYLQQNDIVYVEPNKVKAQNSSIGSSTTLWFTATSVLLSVASLLVNILN